jgi:predicted transcriptional regulator
MPNLNRPLMATPGKPRPRSRTIDMPTETSDHLKTAARYLGISSHRLIQRAIQHELERTYGCMALDESM